jgi:hypothetical protein
VIICLGLLLDAPALVVLGAVFAPLLAPVVGLALGTVVGSYKFFASSLVGMVIGSLLVFIVGLVAGWVGQIWLPSSLILGYMNAELSWINFIVLAVGAVFTSATMAHHERSPSAPSVAMAYTLYPPLAVAGIGLTSGAPHLFPDGLVVFAIYLTLAVLIGAVTLAFLGFRPMTILGYTLGGVITLIALALLVGFSAFSTTLGWFGTPLAVPTFTPTATFTHTPVPPTLTSTYTPVPPTLTPTVTLTQTRTPTPTETFTPTPVPIYARIQPPEGAYIRSAPGFDAPILYPGIMQEILVQLLGNPQEVDGYAWVQIREVRGGRVGWILQSLLQVATPEPNW